MGWVGDGGRGVGVHAHHPSYWRGLKQEDLKFEFSLGYRDQGSRPGNLVRPCLQIKIKQG